MSDLIPLSPSFLSIACTVHSSSVADSDDTPVTPKVRFDHECVLIPDPVPTSRLPRLVTKSYSLPLWKRKQREPPVTSDSEDELNDDHVVFKVSVPSLSIKPRSPSRGDTAHKPLMSCLVHSPEPASASGPFAQSPPRANRPRRASVPSPAQTDAVTVPLRACCAQCYSSIDKCMQEGDHWQVRFSKGAARRRKSVSEPHAPSPSRSARRCLRDAMPGFDSVIAVDEVDRRRRSAEFDTLTAFTLELPSFGPSDADDFPLRRALSLPDENHPDRAPLVSSGLPRARSPASPIPEEDEYRPSPRHTPETSPRASSINLSSTHIMHTVQVTAIQGVPSASDGELVEEVAVVNEAALETPPPATPSFSFEKASSCFSVAYQPDPVHNPCFNESPVSSPSSSPRVEHVRPSGLGAPRKRSLVNIPRPANIFRASTQMLKGMSGMTGMPMSV
ncbi:hypothetical protein BD414DRAFT_490555 [Trametes punicea]|nr:hypothetical protein BD414DRAFT_490555 [Trametes punicea]